MTIAALRRAFNTLLLLIALAIPARADPVTIGVLFMIAGAALFAATVYGLAKLTSYLLKPKPTEGSKQDIRLTTADEGTSVPRVYGTFAVGATIIARGTVTARREQTTVGSGKRQAVNFDTRYSCSIAAVVCENINGNIRGISRIWYNGNVLYERNSTLLDGTNPDVMGDSSLSAPFVQEYGWSRQFQILLGQETQTERCEWFTGFGEDSTPAYRGYVTLWWRDMDLTHSYNHMPQILVEVVSGDWSINDIVRVECSLAGLSPAQITNNAPEEAPIGWFIQGPTPPKQTFEALSMWSPFAMAEVDGKLKAFPLPQASSATVADWELGAMETGREENTEKAPKFSMAAEQPIELPQRVEITFFDPNNAYQQSSAGYARQYGAAVGVQQINPPMATTKIGAQAMASQLLARYWTERDSVAITLPPKYIKYHPGDVLTIPAPNTQAIDMRITGMEFAPGQQVKIEGIRQIRLQGLGYNPDEVSIGDPSPSDENNYIQSAFVIANCPPLIDDHDGFDGVYWGAGPKLVSSESPPAVWQGATLYRNACGSDDTNKVYEPIGSTNTAAVIGFARTVLASATGIDTTNTVDIDVPYGLGTKTILGAHDLAFTYTQTVNLAILGKEVIQFRDVDDVSELYGFPADSGRVWRLYGKLKRGIRDTAAHVGTHVVNEAFMLWNIAAVQRVPVNINEHPQTHNYKAITKGLEEFEINNPLAVTVDPEAPFATVHAHTFPGE
jgi:hypothetical protein